MRKIIIVGASGFGAEVLWVINRINSVKPAFDVVGFCDDASDKQAGEFAGIPLVGSVDQVCCNYSNLFFFCAIGDNRIRKKVFEKFLDAGNTPVSIIDPSAVISPDAVIGDGSYIGVGSVVSVGSFIGGGTIINHRVTVGHDVAMGDFTQLCPGVAVSGGVSLGEGVLFGSNACAIPCKSIGDWAIVGAGSVVISNMQDGEVRVRVK